MQELLGEENKAKQEIEKERKIIEERRQKIAESINKSKEIRSKSLKAIIEDNRRSADGPPLYRLLEEKYRTME
jgi:hypothetical protein